MSKKKNLELKSQDEITYENIKSELEEAKEVITRMRKSLQELEKSIIECLEKI